MPTSSSPLPSRSLPVSSESSTAVGVGVNGGPNYIVHHVSKFDTLAGVAIKYGVEVADIKRMNGLVTDLQMFALKTIHIPLPGRHPPSSSLSNGLHTPQRSSSSEQTPSARRHSDLFDSLQSLKLKSSSEQKVSPAMSSLLGFYGLKPAGQEAAPEGFEMAVYRNGAHYLEDGPSGKCSPISNPPLSHHRKSKSVASDLMSNNGHSINQVSSQDTEDSDSGKWIEKLTRRLPKSEANLTSRTPEKLLKEDNSTSGGFSVITGKSLALRAKSASRAVSGVDAQAGGPNPIPIGLGDSFLDSLAAVRKSSSTSSLQDSDNCASSSVRPVPKWSLKPDFQALSTAAIFEGLPKPMGRKNKAALD
ncbi:Peptidoglycan-binding LysM domain-containing protein [Abeliophyllum distichum]|uniref:Peptidoglycan-binding LysM domain-containing protein n=1 Tax=Abeliophyllum distichum TaxID=126358 RepID=A0ABD1VV74_9LAMI